MRIATLVLLAAASLSAAYRYEIRDGGFAIHNGPGYFNRPLFGTHEPSMLLSGDRPAWALLAPTDVGKAGTLYLAIVTPEGGRWLHLLSDIDSVYEPGLTRHTVRDPGLAGGALEVTSIPLAAAEGFSLRLRWIDPPRAPVRLMWVFGGASGYDTNKSPRIDKLHLSANDSLSNTVRIWGDGFVLSAPTLKGKQVRGTCDLPGRFEVKDAALVPAGPVETAQGGASNVPVALFSGEWPRTAEPVYLVLTMGESLETPPERPPEIFVASLRHYRELAGRVRVETPDPRFDLAVKAMVIANDGLWQPPAFLHGALSWMQPYLGWRVWYGSDAFGWHERVRSAILAHAARQIPRGDNRGAIPHILGSGSMSYNMNEVFLDHIYHHYQWTGDRGLLASLYPVIEGILTWEKRRLDPDRDGLYENCLNTWISDSHWYSGGAGTQASAYMYRAHHLAAEAAEAAGRDPRPWLAEAARIRAAINGKLWLPARGHYAEFIDRLGLARVHTEPELPTLYHPIEFDVADPFQAYQMLRFTETSLRNETDLPGRLVWSSNWKPNYNDSYTHSTNDLIFGEVLNLALAYYHSGRFAQGYDLVRGVYASMYLGGVPGGLSCVAYTNGQQRRNEEFGDTVSLFAKVAVEGVFGIRPELQRGLVHVTPGFPPEWKEAAIRTPDVEYRYGKQERRIAMDVTLSRPARVHYHIPVSGARVTAVLVNGAAADYRLEAGVGLAFVNVTAPEGAHSWLEVRLEPSAGQVEYPRRTTPGESFAVRVAGARILEWKDPQQAVADLRLSGGSVSGVARDAPGHHTLFVRTDTAWQPVDFEIRPVLEIADVRPDFRDGSCAFVLRNDSGAALEGPVTIRWLGAAVEAAVSIPAFSARPLTATGDPALLLPGNNRLEVRGLLSPVSHDVMYWPGEPPRTAREWRPLDMAGLYNESLATVMSRPFWTAEYTYAVCCDYMLEHLVGTRSFVPNDRRMRAGVDARGIYTTAAGIPFAQRAAGNNIVALSLWRDFPARVEIPVGGAARKIYLMLTAITFPMQSHIANARVTVHYRDGGRSTLDLVNPDNFDNGWGGFGGTFHYAANGMEVIGGAPAASPRPPEPVIVLAQHGMTDTTPQPVWEAGWGRSPNTEGPLAPHADLVDVPCDAGRAIRSVEVEVLSNEIIIALLGATLLR